MAFPAYQFMDIPDSQAEDSDLDHQGIISRPISELLSTLPPIINSFLENVTISELLAKLGLKISTERVDDIPVILAILLKMDIPNQIDSCFKTHGNREGLSLGWLITVWLVYIISQQDHRMNHVRD